MIYSYIIVFLLSLSTVKAASPDKEIRSYIDKITKTQQDIAGLLVMQNFSRFMINEIDDDEVNSSLELFLSSDSTIGMSKISKDFFDIVYSDRAYQEKIDSITKILIIIRRSKQNWIELGAKVKRTHFEFFEKFNGQTDVCSEQNFYRSLAVLENFTPEGIDATKFRNAWNLNIGGNVSLQDDGAHTYGGSIDIAGPPKNTPEASARHATATTAGALAMLAPPPWNLVGAVALPILIEATWGMIDMSNSIRQMDKIASANRDLYKAMSYEINVKKHYDLYCNELQKAYLEVQPLVLDINTPHGLENLKTSLNKFNKEDFDDNTKFFSTPDTFYRFAKYKVLNDALTIFGQDDEYFKNWHQVIERSDHFVSNIENALTQIIAQKRQEAFGEQLDFKNLLDQIDNFKSFINTFNNELNIFWVLKDQSEILASIARLKSLIENYQLLHQETNQEEKDVIRNYQEIISKLEGSYV